MSECRCGKKYKGETSHSPEGEDEEHWKSYRHIEMVDHVRRKGIVIKSCRMTSI